MSIDLGGIKGVRLRPPYSNDSCVVLRKTKRGMVSREC